MQTERLQTKEQIALVEQKLFPTLDNLTSVVELGLSQLPIMTPNALVTLLMIYHNSLLKQIQQQRG